MESPLSRSRWWFQLNLIEILAAPWSLAIAWNLILFNRELVVISQFFTSVDLATGKDDNMFGGTNLDDTGEAVRL